MKRILPVLFAMLSTVAFAEPSASEHWKRMETMVRSGIITSEAATDIKRQDKGRKLEERKEAQRGLASVHPDLKPLRLKQLKIEPMILFLD